MLHVFYITIGYFIIGVVATFLANKEQEKEVQKQRWIKILTYFIIVHFILLLLLFIPELFIYFISFIVLIGAYEIIKVGKQKGRTTALITAVLLYIIISIGFLLICMAVHPDALIDLFVIVFVFDGFSQLTGQLFGKRKLMPRVSPGKTLEGFGGGLVAALLTAIIFIKPSPPVAGLLVITTIICLSALAGDLMASFYKRIMGVKDFSNLIPGHCGVLDRFDSLIAAGFTGSLMLLVYFLLNPPT